MSVIEFKDVSRIFRSGSLRVAALKEINLRVQEGEFICVAGPSGSGKSTLLHLAGTLDTPTVGEVVINGRSTRSLSRTAAALFRRRNLGFIFQRFNLIPVLSAFENVEYILCLLNIPEAERKQIVEETLHAVGLGDFMGQRAVNLSGGQQQRVAVARAIVARPEIILADEPTASLDTQTGSALIDLFAELNRTYNTTFIFSSHDSRIIKRASRIIKLEDGELLD